MITHEGDLLAELENTGYPEPRVSAPVRYVLTSNFTLLIMLARGVLLAPGIGESSDVATLDAWGCTLPKSNHGIPGNWAVDVEKSGRNVFPIALRLGEGRDVGKVAVAGTIVEYLLLADVDGIVFRSEEERDRFLSWGFENVPYAGVSELCVVSAEIFGVAPEPLPDPHGPISELVSGEASHSDHEDWRRKLLAKADSIAGLIAIVIGRATRVPGWIRALGSLSELGSNNLSGAGHPVWEIAASLYDLHASSLANDLDSSLLRAATRVMRRHPFENGWPASKVLADICDDDEVHASVRASAGNGEKLAKWRDRCADVIAARALPPALSDFGSIVRRGILLLLIRGGDVTEIAATPTAGVDTGLVVGGGVRMVAFALAGLRMGLRALPAEYKGRFGPLGQGDWRDPLSRFLVADLGRGASQAGNLSSRIEVSYRRRATLEGDWVVVIADAQPIEVRAEFDERLKEVAARLKRLGFAVSDGEEERLTVTVSGAEGPATSVAVEVLRRSNDDAGVVHCESVVELSREPKLGARRPRRKRISAMPKDFFVGLLKEQRRSHLNGMYALSEDGDTLYVVSEQALATLDDAEFKAQIVDMAKRARLSPRP